MNEPFSEYIGKTRKNLFFALSMKFRRENRGKNNSAQARAQKKGSQESKWEGASDEGN